MMETLYWVKSVREQSCAEIKQISPNEVFTEMSAVAAATVAHEANENGGWTN